MTGPSSSEITMRFLTAVAAQTAGRFDEAASLYSSLLATNPELLEARILLSLITGEPDVSVPAIDTSGLIDAGAARALSRLGNAYLNRHLPSSALPCYLLALRLDPIYAPACNNMGAAYKSLNRPEEAETWYRRALELRPEYASALNNLGALLLEKGEIEEASGFLRRALEIQPDAAGILYNLARVLENTGDLARARELAEKALAIDPDFADAHFLLSLVLGEMGELAEAERSYREAIRLAPNHFAAHNNLGNVLQTRGRYEEAATCYRRSVSLQPDYGDGYLNLGIAMHSLGRIAEAERCYHRALETSPRPDAALSWLVQLLLEICDWDGAAEPAAQLDEATRAALAKGATVAEPPYLNILRHTDSAYNLAVAEAWAKQAVKRGSGTRAGYAFDSRRREKDVLHIGYLSADFLDHPAAHLTAGLFEARDRNKFLLTGYTLVGDDGSYYRCRVERAFDRFADLTAMGDMAAARRIYEDGVDILVDLNGPSRNARPGVLAQRPAPIQVMFLGYPGTTGADYLDYFIADKIVAPDEHLPYFREAVVRMPHTYLPTDRRPPTSDKVYSRKELGLPENGIVFLCFNNPVKIEPELFRVWVEILKSVPNSVLWLYGKSEAAQVNLKKEAVRAGLDPNRLIFAPPFPKPEHLARHKAGDLGLDTWTYNGHTTTADALWADLPVLTLEGGHFASRVASSLLRAVGLPELITQTRDEYRDLAIRLAGSPDELAELKHRLKENRRTAPLFDTPRYTANLERAYRRMWRDYVGGRRPGSFDVEEEDR